MFSFSQHNIMNPHHRVSTETAPRVSGISWVRGRMPKTTMRNWLALRYDDDYVKVNGGSGKYQHLRVVLRMTADR